ncbi:anthranilate synthase component I [Robertmurraya kyonggiensis]|uniref:Anthranilate synthase component 1 n=1 Tax=Robertmurraya kyonggiensis TaxID=1037680 RepID=A0A4U1DAB7_9BACI|nr:anthranilate synthase component I [Robertmurraya kyonggiensis]TKC19509.1 anthranilate synthase component I [Robertmurraya kyonggiensis]
MTKLQEQKMIIEELQGDTLTPISIFQRLSGKKKFLLESSLKYEASGRYSFIGASPAFEIKGVEGSTVVLKDGQEEVISEKPLEVLKGLVPNLEDVPDFMPLVGGAVGFVGYDVIRHYESIGETPLDEFSLPDVHFMMFEELVVFDHLQQKVFLVGVQLLETTKLDHLKIRLLERKKEILTGTDHEQPSVKLSSFEPSIPKEEFIEKVKKAKAYIVEGDIFQVVLSQRMKAKIDGDPFSFYRKLRIQNPSPYMYYLDFEDYIVAGASPESLIKATNNKVVTNPIAGTRPRGKTPDEDERLAKELLADEKELAEHQMLVDLGRNDIGRVSEFGSVQIDKYMVIEKYKHVMHLVSEVSGTLTNQYTPLDALIACLPAGTVSGAPKIRAMEIINELEEVKRGVYSGAIGYLSANGNMDFALAIRTMVMKGEDVYIQAGAGIVYDSVPEKEYEETLHKLKAFLEDDK